MSDIRCSKCYGELDTGYVCRVCFNRERVSMDTSSDNTGTCTMGNGWCPLHGLDCPVTISTIEKPGADRITELNPFEALKAIGASKVFDGVDAYEYVKYVRGED